MNTHKAFLFLAFLTLSLGSKAIDPPASAVEKAALTTQAADRKGSGIDSLLQYFDETSKDLARQVEGLSEAQLTFKPAEDRWSISQCLEHIVLSEKMLFDMAKTELQKAPQPERKNEVKVSDENLKHMMVDRSQKFQAPTELQPQGKYKDSKTALTDFTAARAPVLAFIKQADEEDLKNHISEYPTGTVNGHQNLLFIAAHCARHIKQIEEVKADPKFPKK